MTTFHNELHKSYITSLASKLDAKGSYEGAVTEHLKMSGVYWSVAAFSLLQTSDVAVDESMGLTNHSSIHTRSTACSGDDDNNDTNDNDSRQSIVDWVFQCYDTSTGGFGGNIGHDAHLLYTLSALQILAMADRLDDDRLHKDKAAEFVASLQQPDGSFVGDKWGEIDTRFSYCALSSLSILGRLESNRINVQLAAEYIASCQNFDAGFGCVPGAESHAGQIFCCVGALSIANALHLVDRDLLTWWLCERQCDSGGLNGRPEKQADVCYSWWILSVLSILGRVSYINTDKLAHYILQCQDNEDGGIADRPNDMPDIYHTFFGICGLSLVGYLYTLNNGDDFRMIDPVYALPRDTVQRLRLRSQILSD